MNELICSLQKFYGRRGDFDMAVTFTDLFDNCEENETVKPILKKQKEGRGEV